MLNAQRSMTPGSELPTPNSPLLRSQRFHRVAFKGFFKTGFGCYRDRVAGGMVCYASLAAGFRISQYHSVVGFFSDRNYSHVDRIVNNQFPGY